jgi:hypothetical protein
VEESGSNRFSLSKRNGTFEFGVDDLESIGVFPLPKLRCISSTLMVLEMFPRVDEQALLGRRAFVPLSSISYADHQVHIRCWNLPFDLLCFDTGMTLGRSVSCVMSVADNHRSCTMSSIFMHLLSKI